MGVPEALDVVEDEPGERDDHEDDEGDGHKEHGGTVNVGEGVGVLTARGDHHHHTRPIVHQTRDVQPLRLADEDTHHALHCNTKHHMGKIRSMFT